MEYKWQERIKQQQQQQQQKKTHKSGEKRCKQLCLFGLQALMESDRNKSENNRINNIIKSTQIVSQIK